MPTKFVLKNISVKIKRKNSTKSLAENWSEIADEFCDQHGVNLLMAHLYMNKKGEPIIEEPEGEKPIKIGNATLIIQILFLLRFNMLLWDIFTVSGI